MSEINGRHILISTFREQMLHRWQRACRRKQQMNNHMLANDDIAVGDDLAALTAALKEVSYDFCQYAKKAALSGPNQSGYRRFVNISNRCHSCKMARITCRR
jgi:hypothetical protein